MSDPTQQQIMITQNWKTTSPTILSQTTTTWTRSWVLCQSLNRSSKGTTSSWMRLRTSRTEFRRTASPARASSLWAVRVKRRPRAATLPPASWKKSETKRARSWTLNSECSSPRRSGNLEDVSNYTHVQTSATKHCSSVSIISSLDALSWTASNKVSHQRFVLWNQLDILASSAKCENL